MVSVPLTQGLYALLDDEDAHLAVHKWYAHKRRNGKGFYAQRTVTRDCKRVVLHLHREVLRAPEGIEVDHKDGDGLNCRRSNLRLATVDQNRKNRCVQSNSTTGIKGVCFMKDKPRKNPWRAYITVENKRRYLGCFATAEEASRAYDVAAQAFHGEFARLNGSAS